MLVADTNSAAKIAVIPIGLEIRSGTITSARLDDAKT
jgi:hypothetical protein